MPRSEAEGTQPDAVQPPEVRLACPSPAPGSLRIRAVRAREARKSNQRREERIVGTVARASASYGDARHDVQVANISRRGAMIEASFSADVRECLKLWIPGCNPMDCTVRWVRGGRTGVEFAQETVILIPDDRATISGRRDRDQPGGRRRPRPDRHRLMWEGTLYWDDESGAVRLRNISPGGAMVAGTKNIRVGADVILSLRGAGTADAVVRWCRSGHIGLQFERPFDVQKLLSPETARRMTEPTALAAGVLKPLYLQSELDPDSPWAARWERLRREDLV